MYYNIFGKKGVVSICIANVAQSVSTGKPGLCSSVLVLTRLLPFLWQKSVFYFNTKGEFYGSITIKNICFAGICQFVL